MGTNYYLHSKACPHCYKSDPPLHIGKSSAGWCFSLHVIPDGDSRYFPIRDLVDWIPILSAQDADIRDEYGLPVDFKSLYAIITERTGNFPNFMEFGDGGDGWYHDEKEFHEKNHSERGPQGLLRHKLGGNCVKHGTGTWDCITGEFS